MKTWRDDVRICKGPHPGLPPLRGKVSRAEVAFLFFVGGTERIRAKGPMAMVKIGLAGLVLSAFVIGCQPSPRPVPVEPVAVGTSPGPTVSVPEPSDAPGPPSVRCGSVTCEGGAAQCCLVAYADGTTEPRCASEALSACAVDDAEIEARQGLAAIRRLECDDSDDCGGGRVCCYSVDELLGDARCEDISAPGHSPCEDFEVCSGDHACRAPGAVCEMSGDVSGIGVCAGARKQVACETATCAKDTPICCATKRGGFECRPEGGCAEAEKPFRCTHPSDCAGGDVCCVFNDVTGTATSSACVSRCTGRNFAVAMCEDDSQCEEHTTCVREAASSPGLPMPLRGLGGCEMK